MTILLITGLLIGIVIFAVGVNWYRRILKNRLKWYQSDSYIKQEICQVLGVPEELFISGDSANRTTEFHYATFFKEIDPDVIIE